MTTLFLHGDLFESANERSGKRALAFGADCSGTMDAGVAVAFRTRFPAFAEAFAAHGATHAMQPGDLFVFREGETTIYALGIQQSGSRPKVSHLERAAQKMLADAVAESIPVIFLPRLGAGKNGLDWLRVKNLLTELGKRGPTELVVFEQFIRTRPAT